MATQSRALVTRTTADETSNGWEALLPLLDPAVVNAPSAQDAWKKLGRGIALWLAHTVAPFSWLNHLTLAGVIYSQSGIAHVRREMQGLHSFLRWAIPEHYPEVLPSSRLKR